VTIRLAEPEARVLEAFCRRQLAWDADLPARVVSAAHALGVFTVPPLGVLVFAAVPTKVAVDEPVDEIVPLSALADELRAAARGLELANLPGRAAAAGISAGPSLHHLPPGGGWQLPMFAVSGDLVPAVDAAKAEFERRSAGLSGRAQEEVAQDIWQRPAFAGLPMRALHAARQLGMLGTDMSRVSAASCGPWKRLSTCRGQVFVHATGPSARLALHVVR
jgi:hypothetical protein